MCTPDNVLSRLESLNLQLAASLCTKVGKPEIRSATPRQDEFFIKNDLDTPPQQQSAEKYHSPTDTTFTEHSIFDHPFPVNSRRNENDGFSIASATTVEDFASCNLSSFPCVRVASTVKVNSQEGTVNLDDPIDTENREFAKTGPEKGADEYEERPSLIWITSCLQCTLAQLPCSRSLPACSRCIRAGREDMCIVQRRKLDKERIPGEGIRNMEPVHLQLKGEEVAQRERKRILSDELLEAWRREQDRKNWVLPLNDGQLSAYRPHKIQTRGTSKAHPGEGMGRAIPHVLHLA